MFAEMTDGARYVLTVASFGMAVICLGCALVTFAAVLKRRRATCEACGGHGFVTVRGDDGRPTGTRYRCYVCSPL